MTIGLFPLTAVLFPTSRLPLHIYEHRYRKLVADCVRSATPFGIVAVNSGALGDVGVLARVVDVTQQYPDGRFDVIVQGAERFTIDAVRDDEADYLVADVSLVYDNEVPVDSGLLEMVAQLYNQIGKIVFGAEAVQFDPKVRLVHDGSWIMAPKSGLETNQKQQLLEMRNENARLELLHAHLQSIYPSIRKAEQAQRVIAADGYFSA